ncbi:hypothetical protein ALC60_07971 [Trachymyrmex zeteki]|uniref:Uncharacterized protein n=1 Tax=Mycetomoellerius zeteki TaxID=64791 RepID=A0A151WYD8_9HYME|nr:hypothetical protein ALC60_07971 [Trachymyrmex zeteki]
MPSGKVLRLLGMNRPPIYYPAMRFANLILRRRESAEGERVLIRTIVETRDGDRKPDNGIAIIVRAGLLALIKPYIREGESNGMEHDERQGEVSAKERGNGRVRDGIGMGWRSKIELERNEREVLGAVC